MPSRPRQAASFASRGSIRIWLTVGAPPSRAALFYARLAANLASPLPYSVASHISPEFRGAVAAYSRSQKIDVWQVEAIVLLDALADIEGQPKVLVAHNVESLIWQRYHEHEPDVLRRWYIRQQWRKFERFDAPGIPRSRRHSGCERARRAIDPRPVRGPERERRGQRD